ncbi:hypothetical protein JDN40_07915 [Rhodomicrobium vannielii ATCC 17100]|uniref:invasion associated locus B family protein n=1 Tax=Rhodomicrobium vannielii TaxID=1069 RepID=UPI001917E8DD|nr:invasion associated locus B family protein [Rhodomicrobium vannielii]MBJ7534026.1 hypothetical protein [Rhodomicrobium vannielii ATCC 17100]
MRRRLILPLLSVAALSSGAVAQQVQVQQIPQTLTQGPSAVPDPTRPATPPKPKPKPAPVKKPAPAPVPEVKAKLVERVGDWTVFLHESPEGRICFAASAPTDMQPKTAKRTSVIFYISSWQKDGIYNEVSVRQGYAMKANAQTTISLGGQSFSLYALDDKAYARDPAEERKLLSAMAMGGPMTVKATSARGTATTDHYSLEGAPAAVQKLREICP